MPPLRGEGKKVLYLVIWDCIRNMRIAICEDNREHAEILEKMIRSWAEQEKTAVVIEQYQSSEQFLFCMKDKPCYDLIFIDIQMPKINGFQLAKIIREEDRMIFLVFTTGEKRYVRKGYYIGYCSD